MKGNNNYHSNKIKSYVIVFGLFILSFLLVFGGLVFRSKIHPDFPLVFTNAENKLMFITKSNSMKNDIATLEDAKIEYANNDTRYLLYLNKNTLFLLDTTGVGPGEKIADNVVTFGFSKDDRHIYYIDNKNTLYLYARNEKNLIKVASNVNKIEVITGNHLIYNQAGKLIYQKIENDPKVISNVYNSVEINHDNKYILYSVKNDELMDYFVYDISKDSTKKVLENIVKLYDKDNNYTKFIYTINSENEKDVSNVLKDDYKVSDKNYKSYDYEDYTSGRVNKITYEANQKEGKNVEFRNQLREYVQNYGKLGYDLYFKNNDNLSLVAANINKLYYYDLRNQIYSYTTYSFENNALNIKDYKNVETFYDDFEKLRLNSMYLKYGNSNPSLAYKNITTNAKVFLRNNNEYYLLLEDQNYYNLYYSRISNKSIRLVNEVDTKLINNQLNDNYVDGYIYSNYINDRYYLNSISDGKVRTIAEDVNADYVEVSESKDSIYYLKRTGDNTNDLNLYNGIRTSTVANDIYSFLYINNDLIFVTKNYDENTKTSDLYQLYYNFINNKLEMKFVCEDIVDWYSPLKDIDEINEEEDV